MKTIIPDFSKKGHNNWGHHPSEWGQQPSEWGHQPAERGHNPSEGSQQYILCDVYIAVVCVITPIIPLPLVLLQLLITLFCYYLWDIVANRLDIWQNYPEMQ